MGSPATLHSDDLYERLGVAPSAATEEIKRAYRTLLRRYPPERAPEEFKRIREAYETLGDPRSRKEYDERLDPVVERWLQTGLHAMKEEEYDVAERYFKQVLLQAPELAYVRNLLGLCFLYQSKSTRAIEQFERLLREPAAPAAWFGNAGHAYRQLERYADAERAFMEAVRRATDNPVDYVVGLADVYLDQEKYDEAEKALEAGIKADGSVDFQDLRYFTKLLEAHIRERDLGRVEKVLARMKGIATDDEERRYLAWKLGMLSQHLIAAQGFRYAIPPARVARELQPADPDYGALEEMAALLDRNDFAGADRLRGGHASFAVDGWLAQLAENVGRYMFEYRALAQLKPISSAPSLQTINTVGTKLYGQRDHDARTGSYVTTLYFVVLFIPIFPIACYRVIRQGDRSWSFLGKVPFSSREKRHWMAVAALILVAFLWNGANDSGGQYSASAIGSAGGVSVETPPPTAMNTGRVAVYVGEVRNTGVPDSPASLRLAFEQVGSRPMGALTIGPPLGGSGRFSASLRTDSLIATSVSPVGDTILWLGARLGGAPDRIGGRYSIIGGPWTGQGGTWSVSQSEGLPLLATSETPAPGCAAADGAGGLASPSSGAERARPVHGGFGLLRVDNGTDRDAVIVLNGAPSGRASRAMFVRRGEAGSFTRIAPGRYTVQYALGRDLNPITWRFCSDASYSQFDDSLDFEERRDEEGISYARFELTLHRIVGGNATQAPIDAAQFALPVP